MDVRGVLAHCGGRWRRGPIADGLHGRGLGVAERRRASRRVLY
jgi:hypothetical protein